MTGDRLAQIEARANAATEGPWRSDRWEDFTGRETTYSISGDTEVSPLVHEPDDAEFIAHARTDVPALTAALRAVLDRHADDGEGFCRCCEFVWPCWTVRDIEEALR